MINNDLLYNLIQSDCIEHMPTMPAASVDMAVFSPPFPALYAYTSLAADVGNSESEMETKIHLGFFYRQLARVLKPGRVACVHVMQIPRLKRTGEGRGLRDFRGINIRIGERSGLIYEYDWCIRKNPQSQAIRTKSRELQFSGLEADRAKSRWALADYVIKFTAPGDNETPVTSDGEVSRNQWIEWAECCWKDIKETDTLNLKGSKGDNDTKHICPLQLSLINRLIRLYTNPGEIVFSPFAGVGSEGHEALRLGRRFYGCEIKDEYYAAAIKKLKSAIDLREQEQAADLFPAEAMA